MDLIIRNAKLTGREELSDIGIKKGKIVAIDKNINSEFGKEIDAKGNFVTPPFCDPHLQLDEVLSVGDSRFNMSGTLLAEIHIPI